ncbi:MAG: zinc transporter ZntB [Alphaproteobacteria bacterium]
MISTNSFAFALDGKGCGRAIDWHEAARQAGDDFYWLHLDWKDALDSKWLTEQCGVSEDISGAILEDNTRPRSVTINGETMVFLRGVNLNPGADPDDMISLRMLIDARRVITVVRRPLKSIDDVRQAIQMGSGPRTAGDFLECVIDALVERLIPVIDDLREQMDRLEDAIIDPKVADEELDLSDVRRQVIHLRRFVGPQRDALLRLLHEKAPWFDDVNRARLRETADRMTRLVEELESIRDRGHVLQEEVAVELTRQLNRKAYFLTGFAAILVPLNLIAGIFGMNVAGIPGKETPWAFPFIVSCFVVVAVALWYIGWRKKWF